jgi:chromosomal replication initiation ATPase DnaA
VVEGGFTVAEIGRVLRKDHSTICHGIAKERDRRKGEGRAE